jgi:YggT family protein
LNPLTRAIAYAFDLVTIILFAKIIVSYFLNPFHPVRRTLDSIVDPFLDPIRRVIPQTGMIDFSPIVLYLIIRVIRTILTSFI